MRLSQRVGVVVVVVVPFHSLDSNTIVGRVFRTQFPMKKELDFGFYFFSFFFKRLNKGVKFVSLNRELNRFEMSQYGQPDVVTQLTRSEYSEMMIT